MRPQSAMAGEQDRIIRGPRDDSPLPTCTLGQHLLRKLKEHGDGLAQVYPLTGQRLTFRNILGSSISFANWLSEQGVGRGDIVVLVTNLSPECTAALVATFLVGAVAAPLNPSFDKGDLQRMCRILKPKIVLVQKQFFEDAKKYLSDIDIPCNVVLLDLLQEADADICKSFKREDNPDFLHEVAVIMTSSGTTGFPKGVTILGSSIFREISDLRNNGIFLRPDDTIIQLSGIYWITGLYQQLCCIDLGVLNVIFPTFDDKLILKAIHQYKVTYFMMPTHAVVQLARHPSTASCDLRSIRLLLATGTSMHPDSQSFVARTMNVPVGQAFGTTEASFVSISDGHSKPGSAGKLVPNVEAKIVDPDTGAILGRQETGELFIRTTKITAGYYDNPEATAQAIDKDGWFQTGDIAWFDADDCLYIVDRIKDLIKYKGIQVPVSEVETLLLTHPGVKDVGVVGAKHPEDGEHATAFIIKNEGVAVSEEELISLVKGQLASHKWLYGGVRFVTSLPRTATGKLKRLQLRGLC